MAWCNSQASLFLFRSALSQGSHVKWKCFSRCVPGEQWHLRDGLLELWKSALLSQNFGTHYQMMNKDDKQFCWAGPGLVVTKTEDRAANCNYVRDLHRNVNSSISFIRAAYDFTQHKVKLVFQEMEGLSSVHSAEHWFLVKPQTVMNPSADKAEIVNRCIFAHS